MCLLSHFSRVRLFATPWTAALQAPLSMGFSRQEYWSGLPCPPPGDLPHPGIEPASLMSPALAGGFFTTSATWKSRPGHGGGCRGGVGPEIWGVRARGPGVSLCSRLLSVLWGLRALQLCTVCCLIPGQVSCEPVSTDLLTLARDSVPHVTTNESRREAGA